MKIRTYSIRNWWKNWFSLQLWFQTFLSVTNSSLEAFGCLNVICCCFFSQSGIPGKKCGTIIVRAEELSNCRVRVCFPSFASLHFPLISQSFWCVAQFQRKLRCFDKAACHKYNSNAVATNWFIQKTTCMLSWTNAKYTNTIHTLSLWGSLQEEWT